MILTSKQLVESALESASNWIKEQEYAIRNESEFCHIFFHNLMKVLPLSQIKVSQIHSEIKHFRPAWPSRQVASSVDFGIAETPNGTTYEVFLEVKSWIRPTHLKPGAPNSSTSKRKQCVSDSIRLSTFIQQGLCKIGGLIIFEQGSTHLQRLIQRELSPQSFRFEELWIEIGRESMGRRKEHLGLIWIYP